MSLLDPSKALGAMTQLPEGTYGHFPEKVPTIEIYEKDDGTFTPPPLLTKSELIDQIGPDLYEQDVLWFCYDITRYPCVKKFAAVTTTTTTFASLIQYYGLPKLPVKTILRNGAAIGAISGIASLGHCIWEHYQTWKEFQALEAYRDKRSYSIPDFLQRSRDIENYEKANKDEIEAKQREMNEKAERERAEMKKLHQIDSISQFKKSGI